MTLIIIISYYRLKRCGGGQGSSSFITVIIVISLVLVLILECAVACIQSYVFTILRSLYLNELIINGDTILRHSKGKSYITVG